MDQLLGGLAQQLVLLLAFAFLLVQIQRQPRSAQFSLQSAAFVAMMLVSQVLAFEYKPGILLDLRTPIELLSTLIGGPIVGLVVLLAGAGMRLSAGGSGMWAGAFALLIAWMAGSGLFYCLRQQILSQRVVWLAASVMVWLAGMAAVIILPVTWDTKLSIWSEIALPIGLLFPASVLLVGFLFARESKYLFAANEVAEQHYRLQTLSQLLPVGVFRIDAKDLEHQSFVNDEALRLGGLKRGDTHVSSWEKALHEDDREWVTKEWGEAVARGDMFSGEYRFRHANGNVVWVLGQVIPERNRQGEFIGYLGSITDITDQKRNEQKIQDQRAQLQHAERLRVLGQLAGGVAHDFNNILAAVSGGAELIERKHPKDKETTHLAEMIIKASRRAAELTRQLLVFGRKKPLQHELVSVNTLIADVKTILEHTIRPDIELIAEPCEQDYFIRGDKTQLHNALLNLAVNARDAIEEEGSITIQARIETLRREDWEERFPAIRNGPYICLSVSDNGSGITKTTIVKIFEPFFSTKDVGKGTGLGLATVYGTVQQHDGCIEVESERGVGTSFHCYFPLAEETARYEAQAQPVEESMLVGRSALIIDDEEAISEVLIGLLSRAGVKCQTTADGQAAVELCQAHDFDVILLDMRMPKMSGPRVFKELREAKVDAPIILMSGYTSDNEIESLQEQGAAGFLLKPFSREDLLKTVTSVIK